MSAVVAEVTGAMHVGRSRSAREAGRRAAIVAGVLAMHVVLLATMMRSAPLRVDTVRVKVIKASLIVPTPAPITTPTPTAAPAPRERAIEPTRVHRAPPASPAAKRQAEATPAPNPPVHESPSRAMPAPSEPTSSTRQVAQATEQHAPQQPAIPKNTEAPRADAPASPAIATPRRVAHLDCALVKPDYPPQSLRRGEAGTVVVELETDSGGRVSAARVVTSSGYARLDDAAREAVLASRCRPYAENGTPVPARADVPITFNLDE
ncbi:energy transducer TonB [Burkholderia guangdongensis]|uniref:energy transducer TonB n=1 Tax=Burkholderia guangdongensis TaxID=1792500 RepID=UPI0015CE925F|nr:energy transducer TonB [Burkholderia guangdongensis]